MNDVWVFACLTHPGARVRLPPIFSTTVVAKAINAAVSCSDDSFGRSVPAVQMYQVPVVVVNLMSMTAVQQPNRGLVAISVRQG